MKLTEKQLRRIIKEEKAKLLREQSYRHPKTGEDMFLMLNDIVDKLLDMGMDTGELAGELRGLADDVEDSKYIGPGRTPTEEESGIPDSERSVIHNRRPDW